MEGAHLQKGRHANLPTGLRMLLIYDVKLSATRWHYIPSLPSAQNAGLGGAMVGLMVLA